jgi:putative peptidoglycan lipid II flippase
VLFGHGEFGATSVLYSSQSLAAYAIGLPAFVVVKVLMPGFFARGDTSMPVKIGVGCVALNLAMNLAFMVPLAHVGPALATSLAAICNVGALGFILYRRGHFRPDVLLGRRVAAMIAASLLMSVVLIGVRTVLFAAPMHGVLRLAALAALILSGIVAYGVAAQLLGAYDLREAKRMMSSRRGRAGGGGTGDGGAAPGSTGAAATTAASTTEA